MTKSVCIAKHLNKICPNWKGYREHRHAVLKNERTKAAQVYPEKLCKAICTGLIEQMEMDRKDQFMPMKMSEGANTTSKQLLDVVQRNEFKIENRARG